MVEESPWTSVYPALLSSRVCRSAEILMNSSHYFRGLDVLPLAGFALSPDSRGAPPLVEKWFSFFRHTIILGENNEVIAKKINLINLKERRMRLYEKRTLM